jgi:L-iditol 2-dehydrogenase
MYPSGTIRIPGHEIVGTIAKMGKRVQGVNDDQTYFIAPNIGCGHCRQCVSGNNNLCSNFEALGITMDGGFAEYVRIPAPAIRQGNLIPISKDIDAAAAALIEPLACVLRSHDLLKIHPGDIVLVMGAGPTGVLHLKMARLSGASCVIVSDPNEERLKTAVQMGADFGINPQKEDLTTVLSEKTSGHGIDVIIVAAPAHVAQESALELAAIKGRICFFGGLPKDRPAINFNSNLVHYKELMVTATTGSSTENCWRASQIVNSRSIDLSSLISLRIPLNKAIEAFHTAENGKVLKVVLEP